MRNIQPFIQRKVVVLHLDDTIEEAARAMKDQGIGYVVVSDRSSHIVGVLTDRDIVTNAVADSRVPRQVAIADIMSRHPVVVDEAADLEQVIGLLQQYGVRRIPVVHAMRGSAERCVGVISVDDLVASKAISPDDLTEIIRTQLEKRLIAPSGRSPDKEKQRFFDELLTKTSSKLELTPGEAEQLASIILGGLVRRLHRTGALHFIRLLPQALRPALMQLPLGPDESMDLAHLTSEVSRAFRIDEATAYAVMIRFFAYLEEWCDAKDLNHVKAQLPEDLRSYFPKLSAHRKAA